jgi:hypothetical protein
MAVMRRMEQMLHRCHPGDLIKKVEQKCVCPSFCCGPFAVLITPSILPILEEKSPMFKKVTVLFELCCCNLIDALLLA